jgi:hypothetical protein
MIFENIIGGCVKIRNIRQELTDELIVYSVISGKEKHVLKFLELTKNFRAAIQLNDDCLLAAPDWIQIKNHFTSVEIKTITSIDINTDSDKYIFYSWFWEIHEDY